MVITVFDMNNKPEDKNLIEMSKTKLYLGSGNNDDIAVRSNSAVPRHGCIKIIDKHYYILKADKGGIFYKGKSIVSVNLLNNSFFYIGNITESKPQDTLFIFSENEETNKWLRFPKEKNLEDINYFKIGRSHKNAGESYLQLEEVNIPKDYAIVEKKDSGFYITPADNANIFINGEKLTKYGRQLFEKDYIVIENSQIVLTGNKLWYRRSTSGIRIDAAEVKKSVFDKKIGKKVICDNIKIEINPRDVVALRGPSGAGKSTLLKILSGYDADYSGQILLNGIKMNNYPIKNIGYSPQENKFFDNLTLRETLEYEAKICMPDDAASDEIKDRINYVIEKTKLENEQKTIMNNLSGGERKRASIAAELIPDPPLLVLDEPTSGLDPANEKKITELLHDLSKIFGKTIIISTHNPKINLKGYDKTIFMSAYGKICYCTDSNTTIQDLQTFFEINPDIKEDDEILAEIYRKIAKDNRENSDKFAEKWENNQIPVLDEPNEPISEPDPVNKKKWIRIFFDRLIEFITFNKYRLILNLMFPLFGLYLSIFADGFFITYSKIESIFFIFSYSILAMAIFNIAWGLHKSKKLLVLISRNIKHLIRNKWRLTVTLVSPYILALSLSKISGTFLQTYERTEIILFFISCSTLLLGLFNCILEICGEAVILKRANMGGLNLTTYILSKVMVQSIICLIQSFLLTITFFKNTDIIKNPPIEYLELKYFIIIFLTILASATTGILISAAVSSYETNTDKFAILITPIPVMIQMLFSNIIFKFDGLLEYISKFTIIRWSVASLGAISNINSIPGINQSILEELRTDKILETAEHITEGKSVSPEEMSNIITNAAEIISNMYKMPPKEIYSQTLNNLLLNTAVFIIFIFAGAAVSSLILKLKMQPSIVQRIAYKSKWKLYNIYCKFIKNLSLHPKEVKVAISKFYNFIF
jgi:ABC-type multidrug transport system ATPase subunit